MPIANTERRLVTLPMTLVSPQQIKDMYCGYDEVTGVPDYMEENCCLTVRSYFCKGDWFESKKSFIDKLVCLFK